MAVPIIDGNTVTRIGTRTVAPVSTSPVPASQPKNQLYQAVDGSVWAWNPYVNAWQKRQSAPSPTSTSAPQLAGTITNPIAGKPGAFVTIKNPLSSTAPGIVNIPTPTGMKSLTIPVSGNAPITVTTISNPAPTPARAASYNAPPPPAPTTTNPFFMPAAPINPPTAETITTQTTTTGFSFFPWIVLIVLALILFGGRKENAER